MIRTPRAGARACVLLAVAAAFGARAGLCAQEPATGTQAEEAADFARRAALAALHGPPKVFLESLDADGILRRLLGSPVWSGLTERQRALLRTVAREHFAQALAPVADASAEVAWASVADSGHGPVFVYLGLRYGPSLLKTRWTVDAHAARPDDLGHRARGPRHFARRRGRAPARTRARAPPRRRAAGARPGAAARGRLPRDPRDRTRLRPEARAREAPDPVADGRRTGPSLSRGRSAGRSSGPLGAVRPRGEPASAALEAVGKARPRRAEGRPDRGRPLRVGQGDRGGSSGRTGLLPARPGRARAGRAHRGVAVLRTGARGSPAGSGRRPRARDGGPHRRAPGRGALPVAAVPPRGGAGPRQPRNARRRRDGSGRHDGRGRDDAGRASPRRRELEKVRARGAHLRPLGQRRGGGGGPPAARGRGQARPRRASGGSRLPFDRDGPGVGRIPGGSSRSSFRPPPTSSSPRRAPSPCSRSPRAGRRRTRLRPRTGAPGCR